MTESERMSLKVVETDPQSPLDYLWRKFPQLKNATCVSRASYSGGVSRVFRLPSGEYLWIESTEDGDKLYDVDERDIKIYEDVWKELGTKALGKPTDQPHGIMFASDKFFQLTEERIYDFDC